MDTDELIREIERWLDDEVCEYCEWSWECPDRTESCMYLKIKRLLEWVKGMRSWAITSSDSHERA